MLGGPICGEEQQVIGRMGLKYMGTSRLNVSNAQSSSLMLSLGWKKVSILCASIHACCLQVSRKLFLGLRFLLV